MKKIYTSIVALLLIQFSLNAQTLVVSTGFDNYAGTVATVPQGWYLSWNTSLSFYTSTGNYGVAAPSYKFGNDSDFVVAPFVQQGIDSISFFAKGNGTPFSPANELQFFQSNDSINWTLVATLDSFPTTGTTFGVALNGSNYLKLLYRKQSAGGNLAFDDAKIYSNGASGIPVQVAEEPVKLFPSPSTGLFYLQLSPKLTTPKIEIFDLLGNILINPSIQKEKQGLYKIDLSNFRNGFYFIKIQSGNSLITKRITIID